MRYKRVFYTLPARKLYINRAVTDYIMNISAYICPILLILFLNIIE